MTLTGQDAANYLQPTTKRRPNWKWIAVGALVFIAASLLITALRPAPEFSYLPNEAGMALKPTADQAPYLTNNHIIATIVMTLIGIVGVVIGARMSLKSRSWLPLMVGLSGAMIVFPEVFFDVMGAVYFPHSNTEILGETFSILGRVMPVWISAGWFGYGVFAVVTYSFLASRPRTGVLWWAWGGALAGDVVFEELLLKLDVYHYYGNQPLVLISELPWWWIPCNSVGVMLAAAIAYRFRNNLRGAGALCMFVVTPMSVAAVYGFIALPSWIVTNGNFGWFPTQMAGFATLILGGVAYMGVLKFVLNRDPFDLDYKPTEESEFLRVN